METSEKIQGSGILQLFASLLIPQSSCTAKVANIVAEVAKNGEVFLKNFSAGNISSFTPYLSVCFINLCFNFVDYKIHFFVSISLFFDFFHVIV